MSGPTPDLASRSEEDSRSLTYAFNAGAFAATKKFLDNSVRIQRQVIYRAMRRAALREIQDMDRRDEARRKPPHPRPKKPSAGEIVADAEKRHLDVLYRWQTTKTAREEFRRVAREAGVSVKQLRHIRALLAAMDLQRLLAGGRLVLPTLGHLRLVESEPRRRAVNVRGKIGLNGEMEMIDVPVSARVRFRVSLTLKRALGIANDVGLLVLESLERPKRHRSMPVRFRNRSSRSVKALRPVTAGIPKE